MQKLFIACAKFVFHTIMSKWSEVYINWLRLINTCFFTFCHLKYYWINYFTPFKHVNICIQPFWVSFPFANICSEYII